MSKIKKRILKTVLIVSATIFLLLVLPVILLSINAVQNFVVQKLTAQLSETLQTKVEIQHIDLQHFNTLSVEKLLLYDQTGDTLIYAPEINGSFSLLKLFKKRVEISTISLNNANINLKIDSTGILNAEFLKILFEKKDSTKKSLFVFQIDDIQINNCNFSFINLKKGDSRVPRLREDGNDSRFDASDIFLSNINSRISIGEINQNNFSGNIKKFSFLERSGFELKDFSTDFLANDSLCKITKTKLTLENSSIILDSILLTYNGLDALKTNFEKTGIETSVFLAQIKGKDFAPFSPVFANLKDDITMRIRVLGTVENLIIERLELNSGNNIAFSGNAQITSLPDLQHAFVIASINELRGTMPSIQDMISQISRRPFVFPNELQNLGKVSYKGKISGYVGNLSLLGLLSTNIGSVKTDLNIHSNNEFADMVIEGNVNTSNLDLAKISSGKSGLGKIKLDADATIKVGKNVPFESKINAKIPSFDFHNYTYNNLIINGKIAKNMFEGNASVNDENGKLDFYGQVNLGKNEREFHFNASVKNFKPHALNLIKSYPDLELSFDVNADFQGDNIENINGEISLNSLIVKNNGIYKLDNLLISAQPKDENLLLLAESDLLNGFISGNYHLKKLPNDFLNVLKNYLPTVASLQKSKNEQFSKNTFDFYFEIEPLQKLCDVLEINATTTSKSTVSGFYNGYIQRFNAEIDAPTIQNKNTIINGTNLHCYNDDKSIRLYVSSEPILKNDTVSVIFKADFANDGVQTVAILQNSNKKNVFAGEILAHTQLFKKNDSLMLKTNILPTQIVLKNNVLDIKKSNIETNFKYIDIDNFAISGDQQNIFINGRASKSINDHVLVKLENIDLALINNFIRPDVKLSFGGLVSGNADISRVFQKPIMEAKVQSPMFYFNDTPMGFADATSTFDHDRNCLVFNGIVTEDRRDTVGILDGGLFFSRDSFDIVADGNKINLGFIQKFTNNIFDKLDGKGTGKVHIIGNTKKRQWTVETTAKVDDGHLKIGYLNADFYFSDSITLKKDSILFRKIPITDAEGNKGMMNGYVAYKFFDNINYRVDLQCNKMLIFNGKKGGDAFFWGKGYATGTGLIAGNAKQCNISANGTSEPKTKIHIPLDFASSVTSTDFITFVNNKQPDIIIPKKEEIVKNSDKISIPIVIDITLNVMPSAELELIMDTRAGDKINATGEGSVRISYNTKTEDFQMLGNYNLQEGKYLFTLQEVIRREFRINEGSSLQWTGVPSNPIVNINAVHQVDAPLTDLFDEAILSKSNRKNVPVNCLLNLTGNLLQPVINFDLNLPSSDDELNRALKNVVNTDELMNREVIYLLAIGRFYNPNYTTETQTAALQNDALSVVTSTISQQLNNMASQLFDKINFGVNLKLDNPNLATDETAQTSNEYSLMLNYTPNNRLVINSNVGYKEDNTSENTNTLNNYIIDFELEYKLIQSGKLNFKAYNKTNNFNDYIENNAQFTQGIGLVYRENFNSLKDLKETWRKNREDNKAYKQQKKEEKNKKKEGKK
ncbi:MAG: hypothetical protein LBN95_04590 [Prevotellaceae bacterium]|nr:hypothetical protein [Prevotellaceae bacterium]